MAQGEHQPARELGEFFIDPPEFNPATPKRSMAGRFWRVADSIADRLLLPKSFMDDHKNDPVR